MTAGANPAFGRNPEAKPSSQLTLRVGQLFDGGASRNRTDSGPACQGETRSPVDSPTKN